MCVVILKTSEAQNVSSVCVCEATRVFRHEHVVVLKTDT